MVFRPLLLTCLLFSRAALADTVSINGSVLGFFFDPTQGVQPILGITGSSTIGAPLNLQVGFSSVAISPRQDYALAVTAPSASVMEVTLGSSASIAQIAVPVQPADLTALSPTGSAAALYDLLQNKIQVISALPAAPVLAREVDLSGFAGTLTTLAISDAADAVLAAFSGSVVAIGADGTIRSFSAPQQVTAAAFLAGGRDALVAGTSPSSVYLIKDVMGSSDPVLLGSDPDGISNPVAVAASKDNQTAVVAVAAGVAAIPLPGGPVAITSCPCQPSGLAALNGNAVFRLTEPSGGPLWLFDGDAPQPRIVFVPPYQGGAGASSQ